MKYISVPMEFESIGKFYDHCANVLKQDGNYDCTKIEVSQERFELIRKYYDSKETFAYAWLMYGPKVNEELEGEVVKVEDGFIC